MIGEQSDFLVNNTDGTLVEVRSDGNHGFNLVAIRRDNDRIFNLTVLAHPNIEM